MVALFFLIDEPDGRVALRAALSQLEPAQDSDVWVDEVYVVEHGVRLYRWLAVGGHSFGYPDVVHMADGTPTPVVRRSTGGYLSPDGEGRWAVFHLDARAHMYEEAAVSLLDHVDPEWGRYGD